MLRNNDIKVMRQEAELAASQGLPFFAITPEAFLCILDLYRDVQDEVGDLEDEIRDLVAEAQGAVE